MASQKLIVVESLWTSTEQTRRKYYKTSYNQMIYTSTHPQLLLFFFDILNTCVPCTPQPVIQMITIQGSSPISPLTTFSADKTRLLRLDPTEVVLLLAATLATGTAGDRVTGG
jgi:hypothetical protein